MRIALALIPLTILAAPAIGQPAKPPLQVPPQLTDPATAQKLANVMQAMSKAFLDLPVGQVEAAVEGRPATPADKRRRVRDIDPDLDRDLQAQMANARPMIEGSMKALAEALPAMMKSFDEAQRSLDRAAANMPDPTYPKR